MSLDLKKGKQGLDLTKNSPTKSPLNLDKPKPVNATKENSKLDLTKPKIDKPKPADPITPKKSKTWLWALLVVVLILLIFMIKKCKPHIDGANPAVKSEFVNPVSDSTGKDSITPEPITEKENDVKASSGIVPADGNGTKQNNVQSKPGTEASQTGNPQQQSVMNQDVAMSLPEFNQFKPTNKPAEKVQLVGTVNFDFDSSDLTTDSEQKLLELINDINTKNPKVIRIDGFGCNIGPTEAIFVVSVNRAKAVENFLKSRGLNNSIKIALSGYGSDYPVGDNSTQEGRALNRRVEIATQ